jgi:aryl carrier-like protein
MSSTKTDIMHLVDYLGPSHALAAVITLEELGIEKYPLTSAGKVRKNVLKELIAKHFHVEVDNRVEAPPEGFEELLTPPLSTFDDSKDTQDMENSVSTEAPELTEIINQLTDIWTTLVISPPTKDNSVYDFADSISLLRYCDKVWRNLGKKLYLQDFMEHDTIEKQAQLLHSREESLKKTTSM